jgi:acetyltransferase-like isoleucine patch superfamily enzyme
MKDLFKNPVTLWILWYFRSRKLLIKNKNKSLYIGYMTDLFNVRIGKYNTFYSNVLIANSQIDDFVYVSERTRIINASIGKFCSIASDVRIGLTMHPTQFISTFPAFFSLGKQCQVTFATKNYFDENGKILIGNDTWIGANAIILDNVIIGDGAVIAAGSVVTKNVEPYSIVGGVPAKLIKKRFTDTEIENLLSLKWWNKDISWLKKNHDNFNNPQEFFKKGMGEKIK